MTTSPGQDTAACGRPAPGGSAPIDCGGQLDRGGQRPLRTNDLVRFGKFTGNSYLWAWKGNAAAGTGTDVRYNLYPIPSNELSANPNLKQNAGY